MNVAAKDANTTSITVSDMRIENLAVRRGQGSYTFAQPITMKLAAAVAVDAKGAMSGAQVTQLDGKLGVADVAMSTPIKITSTPTGQTLDGAVSVNGQIQNVTGLLEALDAKAPGSVYPYQGSYAMTQAFTTDPASGNTSLKGSVTATDFKVIQNGKATFSEQKLAVANDVNFNVSSSDASKTFVNINAVTIDMQSSGALKLTAKGVVTDLNNSRTIDPAHPLAIDVDYDAAKLQPIIKPIIASDPQSAIADLQMAGKEHESYQVTGSFPSGAFNESIKHLRATGAVAAQTIDTNGLKIQNFNVPISLDSGILTVPPIAPSTPATTQPTPTAMVNGGTLDISNAKVDLTTPTPRITLPANQKLIFNVQINPVLASKLAKGNPLISPQSSGALNITVINCQRLPAGGLLNVASDPKTNEVNDGTATFQVSASGLGLGGKLVDEIATVVPNIKTVGSVDLQPSSYTFAKGEITQKSNLSNSYIGVITLDGGIRLADLSYDKFTVTLPSKLYGNYAALGNLIAIPVAGTLAHPTIDKNIIGSALSNITKNPENAASAVEQLLTGKKPANPPPTSSPAKGANNAQPQQQPSDINSAVNDLRDIFGGSKKKDKKKSK
jgi:hypothetical protein